MLIDDLRAARLGAGLTQSALAERIGVNAQVVQRLEQGIGSASTLSSAMDALEFRLTGLGSGSTLAERLRSRRRSRSMSLEKIASKAGLARGTVVSLERGGGSVASLQRLLTALVPRARRRAPERSYWGEGDKVDRDSRFTPPEFMQKIYAAFGGVDVDPCAHKASPVVARRRILLSEGGNGLVDDWTGQVAFVNPPFSQLLTWLRRAHQQWQVGNVETVLCLVPVRTDSAWFHETLSADADIYLLKGRVRFLDTRGKGQQTPFSLMLLTLGATPEHRTAFAAQLPGFWLARSPS